MKLLINGGAWHRNLIAFWFLLFALSKCVSIRSLHKNGSVKLIIFSLQVHACWKLKKKKKKSAVSFTEPEISRERGSAGAQSKWEMRQQFYFFFQVSPFTFACMYSIQEGILWLGVKAQAWHVIFHGVLIFHFNPARRRVERLLCCDFSEEVRVAHAHSVLLKPIEHFELSPLSLWKQPFSKKKQKTTQRVGNQPLSSLRFALATWRRWKSLQKKCAHAEAEHFFHFLLFYESAVR